MSILSPEDAEGFGNAVRRAKRHGFVSHITRFQAGDEAVALKRARVRKLSLIAYGIVLAGFVLLSPWCGQVIGSALVVPLDSLRAAGMLFAAILLTFLGIFAFMRLGQAAMHALFDVGEVLEWPRKDVDWGKQSVVLDEHGIAIANRFVRRTYHWDTMAELIETDVFVVRRKDGSEIVIPKDPDDEDDLRVRLMRGITSAEPVRRPARRRPR